MSDGGMILVAGALLALAITASLLASRLRIPGLALFLVLGMVLGDDGGLGWINLDDVELTRRIGVIALALILFEGGLAAGWSEIRPVLGTSLSLAGIGTLGTAGITALAAHWLLDLTLLNALLLASIVAATDSAAIFAVLRGSTLKRRLARTLEAESGLNDPFAVLLVLGFIDWIQEPGYGVPDMALLFLRQIAIGGAIGGLVGYAAMRGLQRVRFSSTGLYPVATVATAALAFGAADTLGGSGFLSVYLTGLVLGTARIPAKRTIEDFHDGVAWVSQIALFFTLGLLVSPSGLSHVIGDGLLIAGALMLVARPLATFVATRVGRYDLREVALLGWAGLRGAVPIVLATFPVIEDIPHAQSYFSIVFFVVMTSALLQGSTAEPLARWLGLTSDEPAMSRPLVEIGTVRRLGAEVVEHHVQPGDAIVGAVVNQLGLPREAIVSFIVRGEEAILPRGSTPIEAGDSLHILVRQRVREQVEGLIERWREGPIGTPGPLAIRVLGRARLFTVRPLRPDDGDPAEPDRLGGVPVLAQLRTRRDRPGALVQLADGRFAVAGERVVALGSSRHLFRYCRDQIGRAAEPESRAWWQEVAGVLSQRAAL
jgi:potassium/hydrogen antiporter